MGCLDGRDGVVELRRQTLATNVHGYASYRRDTHLWILSFIQSIDARVALSFCQSPKPPLVAKKLPRMAGGSRDTLSGTGEGAASLSMLKLSEEEEASVSRPKKIVEIGEDGARSSL